MAGQRRQSASSICRLVDSIVALNIAAARNGEPACWNLNEKPARTPLPVDIQNTVPWPNSLRTVRGSLQLKKEARSDTIYWRRLKPISSPIATSNIACTPLLLLMPSEAETPVSSGFSLLRGRRALLYPPSPPVRRAFIRKRPLSNMYEKQCQLTYTANNLNWPGVRHADQVFTVPGHRARKPKPGADAFPR